MIKRISEKDIPECVEVIKTSFLTVAEKFGITAKNAPRFTAFATNSDRLLWQLQNEKREMYAYYKDGKIIGYYSLLFSENDECELNNLCVLPEYRCRGIGGELLYGAFDTAKASGCKKMTLGFVEENVKLKEWYSSFGFMHTGVKKFDFFPFTCGYMEKAL